MMQEIGSWIVPLTFIPAVGLIIMSTSARFSALSTEINSMLKQEDEGSAKLFQKQMKRSRLFNNALVSLYVAVACFSLGALFGGLGEHIPHFSYWSLMISICLGVLCMVYASIQLIVESIITRQVIESKCMT
ncbi:MAG: DUF2721 domain-containing protein [Flammeovirgaceae bacterium]